jgi:predicted  nucleic acid-binding Zn-ribbon protein
MVNKINLFLIKLVLVIVVGITMYASVIVLNDDILNNSNDIDTINRKITSLEEASIKLERDIELLKMTHKALRTSINTQEQSATGGVGVLTGNILPEEE